MLLGDAVMRTLVLQGHDNAGLVIIAADHGDARAFADHRLRAIAGNQQFGLQHRAIVERHHNPMGIRLMVDHLRRQHRDADSPCLAFQSLPQCVLLHHRGIGALRDALGLR